MSHGPPRRRSETDRAQSRTLLLVLLFALTPFSVSTTFGASATPTKNTAAAPERADGEEAYAKGDDNKARAAHASTPAPPPSELARLAVQKTEHGAFSEAIELFERLSDQGYTSADLSYNRANAYLQRAESPKAEERDLGQAAAALREAQTLGDDRASTNRGLEEVHKEIARLRAQVGKDPVVARPALDRALLGLLPLNGWAALTLVSTLLTSLGLLLLGAARGTPRRLLGQVLSVVGVLFWALFASGTYRAESLRTHSSEAVVVASEARLLDAGGKALTAKALDANTAAIPQGASVFVTERQGALVKVEWGTLTAWVYADRLRLLANAPARALSPR